MRGLQRKAICSVWLGGNDEKRENAKRGRLFMNWPRIIPDGLSMSLLFNSVVGVGFLLFPQAYSTMFPKEIKEAAAPFLLAFPGSGHSSGPDMLK